MTTYLQPLQRESDRRWDFTSSTGSTKPRPIGYCAGWKEPPGPEEAAELNKRFGAGFAEGLTAEIEEKRAHQAKYHMDGHATADEASACYDRYKLDNELELHSVPIEKADTLRRCEAPGCGVHTAGVATLKRFRRFYLCPAHLNRDVVAQLIDKE